MAPSCCSWILIYIDWCVDSLWRWAAKVDHWTKIDLRRRVGCRAPYPPPPSPNSQRMFLRRRKEAKTAPPNLNDRSVASADSEQPVNSKVHQSSRWVGRILPLPPPIHAPRRRHMHSARRWLGACKRSDPERIESKIFGRNFFSQNCELKKVPTEGLRWMTNTANTGSYWPSKRGLHDELSGSCSGAGIELYAEVPIECRPPPGQGQASRAAPQSRWFHVSRRVRASRRPLCWPLALEVRAHQGSWEAHAPMVWGLSQNFVIMCTLFFPNSPTFGACQKREEHFHDVPISEHSPGRFWA